MGQCRTSIEIWFDNKDKIMTKAEAQIEMIKRVNRRRQAWVAMWSMVGVTLLLMFAVPESKIKIITDILPFFYITMASVVGAYHGFSAWLGKKK